MGRKSEPEGAPESPIPFHPCSNGEAPPLPRVGSDRRAEALYQQIVEEKAHRLGISRREFTQSACGMAAALFVMNKSFGCSRSADGKATPGDDAGFTREAGYDVPADVSPEEAVAASNDAGYDISEDQLEDQAQAADAVSGTEVVFDVQTHNRVSKPPWLPDVCSSTDPMTCPTSWIRQIFVSSDTAIACLSGFPAARNAGQPSLEARQKIKEIVDALSGSPRLLLHANIRPVDGSPELDAMEGDAKMFPVAAWKVYPEARGLDTDDIGRPFLERARTTGVKVIAAHRGLNGDGSYMEAGSPRDMAVAAKAYPDLTFLVYHSGWQSNIREDHPFNPTEAAPRGIDRLIKAALDNSVASANLYAELGSTWNGLMRDTAQAAHALGKLLKYLGPDRILWGTDCVLNGGPQEQIAAFRTFEIPAAMQAMFGYPALTPEIRRKILGQNAARVYGVDLKAVRREISSDDVAKIKLAWREDRRTVPVIHTPGPRTWREYLDFRRSEPA